MTPATLPAWAAAIAAVSMWAGWAVATRGTLGAFAGQLDAWDLVALRFAVAAAITLPIAIVRPPRLGRLSFTRAVLTVCTGGFTFSLCNTGGFAFAPAAHGGALTSPLGAVFVGALAAWLLRERPSSRRIAGLALILLGAGIILLANIVAAPSPTMFIGHALFAAAGLQWAIYLILLRQAGLYPVEAICVVCLGSALIYLPLWALLHGPQALFAVPWPTLAVQGVLHGVIGQTLSIALFNFGVSRLGPSRAAACGALVPSLVAAGAALFLGELPKWTELPGLVSLTAGVWLATTQQRATQPP